MYDALTVFDSCWACLEKTPYRSGIYYRYRPAGEQARPYVSVRNGYYGYDFVTLGENIDPTNNPLYRMKPYVGACLLAH